MLIIRIQIFDMKRIFIITAFVCLVVVVVVIIRKSNEMTASTQCACIIRHAIIVADKYKDNLSCERMASEINSLSTGDKGLLKRNATGRLIDPWGNPLYVKIENNSNRWVVVVASVPMQGLLYRHKTIGRRMEATMSDKGLSQTKIDTLNSLPTNPPSATTATTPEKH